MFKTTQKELKELIRTGAAVDVTTKSDSIKTRDIIPEAYDKIAYSAGIYGANGALYKGCETGQLYAVTARTSNLFILG